MNTTSKDNIYPVGTFVKSKVDPTLPLVIRQYYQRIYYCEVVADPAQKHLAFFERELIPPAGIKPI